MQMKESVNEFSQIKVQASDKNKNKIKKYYYYLFFFIVEILAQKSKVSYVSCALCYLKQLPCRLSSHTCLTNRAKLRIFDYQFYYGLFSALFQIQKTFLLLKFTFNNKILFPKTVICS